MNTPQGPPIPTYPQEALVLLMEELKRMEHNIKLSYQELLAAKKADEKPELSTLIENKRMWLVEQHKDPQQRRNDLLASLANAAAQAAAVAPSDYFARAKYGVTRLAPSSAASFENYRMLQTEGDDAPFFLSGRPPKAKALPLALVHEAFGEFLTNSAEVQPSPDTFDFVLEACALLAEFHADEKNRQQLFNNLLGRYLGKIIYCVSPAYGASATDGSIVDKLENFEFACLHIENKKDLLTGFAADPTVELMAYHYCLLNRMASQSQLASSPCFGVVVIGCVVWICGLAFVGKLAFQPLAPMFHMLDLRSGQPAYMEQMARAFEALRHGVTRLSMEYAASPMGVRQALFVPHPLTDISRWSQVQPLLANHSLLYFARNAQTKAARVIKYVTKYGTEVEMELLAKEDGWVRLDMMSGEELSRVTPAVLAALDRVHALCLPNGDSVVLADCRACNVLVKEMVGGNTDVLFIDFDWAGEATVAKYPSFMNHRDVPWPAGVKEGALALQKHDTQLPNHHLPKVSTAALLKLPVKQHTRHTLWCFGTLRHPLVQACRPSLRATT